MEPLKGVAKPLKVADILEFLTTQPDCACISMSIQDFSDLRADLSATSYQWPATNPYPAPQIWQMDGGVFPEAQGTIFGVPIVIV